MRKTWATLIGLLLCLSLGELASAQCSRAGVEDDSTSVYEFRARRPA